jgi:hypothetical protein
VPSEIKNAVRLDMAMGRWSSNKFQEPGAAFHRETRRKAPQARCPTYNQRLQ